MLGELFEGYFADTCAEFFSLMSMVGQAENIFLKVLC
jgi:hypothetical protein